MNWRPEDDPPEVVRAAEEFLEVVGQAREARNIRWGCLIILVSTVALWAVVALLIWWLVG